jgi:4-carboxymuconolactone decarboxylase
MMSEETYQTGLSIRREVLGDEYVDKAMANADEFNADFQRIVTEYCWGACWGRGALDRKQRSLINISMLAAMGRWEEFELHFNGALNNGCSHDGIKDALFHVAVYAGIPAGVSAFKNARRILKEREAKG